MTVCRSPLSWSRLGVKRTSASAPHMSPFDPKRTFFEIVSSPALNRYSVGCNIRLYRCPSTSRQIIASDARDSQAMRRRRFIQLIAAGVSAWPFALRAEVPVIGYLSARSPEDTAHLVEAFRRGLSEAGFFEGHNVTIEYCGRSVRPTDCRSLPRTWYASQ